MDKPSDKQKNQKLLIIKSGCAYNYECEYNKGSLAVVITATKTIKEFLPLIEIETFIQLSEPLAKRLNINVIRKNKINKLRDYSIVNSASMSLNVVRCSLWSFFNKLGLNLGFLKNNYVIKVFESADIIADLSLDAYSDDYGTRHVLEISKEILIGKLLGKPVMIYAQSVGPFNNRLNKFVAKYVLNKVDLISVREELSNNYLIEAGINKPPIHITADQAFLLKPVPQDDVNKILIKENIELNNPVFGIAISKMKEVKKSTSGRIKYLLYSWMMYLLPERLTSKIMSFVSKTNYYKNFEANMGFQWLEDVIEHLVDEYDATILLIPHIISKQNEIFGDDRTTIKKIQNNLKEPLKSHVNPILGNYCSEELKGLIGQCDIFIGEKMHANVGAVSQNIPTLGLAYSHKFHGIMKMLGQEEYVLDTTDSKIIIKKIDELWNNKEKISKELKEKMEGVKEKAHSNGKLLADLLLRN